MNYKFFINNNIHWEKFVRDYNNFKQIIDIFGNKHIRKGISTIKTSYYVSIHSEGVILQREQSVYRFCGYKYASVTNVLSPIYETCKYIGTKFNYQSMIL